MDSTNRIDKMDLIDRTELKEKLADVQFAGMGWYKANKVVDEMFSVKAVLKSAYEQVAWERDMAIAQLENYGVQFGEKADVVPVVRCKDCKFSKKSETPNAVICTHEHFCIFFIKGVMMRSDSFCSFGKRKE